MGKILKQSLLNQSTGTSETWELRGPYCGSLISIFSDGPSVKGGGGPTS